MKRRHPFIPSAWDRLEGRVVLTQSTLGASPVVSGLAPHLQVLNRKQTALVAEVNQAFDSFQSDFDQARATYFASIATSPTTTPSAAQVSAATNAFLSYTEQRTQLLAQQLIGSFVQTPGGSARAHSQPYALKQLIQSKIIGPKGKGPGGSLIESLNGSIDQVGGNAMIDTSPTTTLYTLSQDNAIEAARTAVLNGVSIIKNGSFGVQTPSQ